MGSLLKILGGSLNVLLSGFNAGMNGAMTLVNSALKGALQYHQSGIEFARSMGMSLQQAQAYTTVLTQRAADLGFKYGVAAEAVKELQENIAEASGKAVMLNNADAERLLQINKLVGSSVSKQFTNEIMTHLGGQIHTVEGAISKAYATAAKSGLNAAQFSDKVAKNLSLANKLSFRNGINGIIKMTALSEKLGFNLQSVENAAGNFMEIDKAIENSAKLQMLGGAAGAYGSNPLTMSYEANYNPEAFTERMTKTLGGYATFDAASGEAKVNGMNRDFVKNIAQAMGIGFEEAMSIAKKQAEIKYKENNGYNALVKSMNLSDEQKDYIINTSYVGKDGNLKMTDASGKEKNVTEFSTTELEQMMSMEGKSDEEIMKQQAITLTSINEKLKGLQTSAEATLAKAVNPHIDDIQRTISRLGGILLKETRSLVTPISKVVKELNGFVEKHMDSIEGAIHAISVTLGFVLDHWKAFALTWVAFKSFKLVGNLANIFRRGTTFFTKGSNIVSRSGSAAAKTFSNIKSYGKYVTNNYRTLRSTGGGIFKSAFKALKTPKILSNGTIMNGATGKFMGNITSSAAKSTLAKSVLKGGKLVGRLAKGGGIGIVGALGNMATDAAVEKGVIKKRSATHYAAKMASTAAEWAGIGAMLGPIGAGVGALAGSVKGAYDTWKSLPENADKNFIDYAASVGKGVWDGAKKAVSKMGEAFSSVGKAIDERGGFITVLWKAVTFKFRIVYNGIKWMLNAICNPFEAFKKVSEKIKAWWNSDNKIGMLWDGLIDSVFGEKKDKSSTTKDKSKKTTLETHANGGIVGGNSYVGDKVLTGLNSGEMVLNKEQQAQLFKFISYNAKDLVNTMEANGRNKSLSIDNRAWTRNENTAVMFSNRGNTYNSLPNGKIMPNNENNEILSSSLANHYSAMNNRVLNRNDSIVTTLNNALANTLNDANESIKSKPVGEREYIYIPNSANGHSSTNEITVKDINLNINGTLKLDSGGRSKDVDIKKLLEDSSFISSLKDLIKQSINNDINNGRFMNDIASMRGMPSQVGLWGRK